MHEESGMWLAFLFIATMLQRLFFCYFGPKSAQNGVLLYRMKDCNLVITIRYFVQVSTDFHGAITGISETIDTVTLH
jgi:hypothetical protein